MGDAINLREDILKIMARSGCIGIKFGVESGSKRILKTIDKPINLKKVKEIAGYCKRYRIKTQAAFTIGLLEETQEDIRQTVRFANSLDVDSVQMSIATPFPGTDFFRMVIGKKYLEDVPWGKYNGKTSTVVNFPELDKRKIENIRRGFLTKWFLLKLFLPVWWLNHFYILFRTIKGLGMGFLLSQLVAITIDERKNR